jgi:hypothetical protein
LSLLFLLSCAKNSAFSPLKIEDLNQCSSDSLCVLVDAGFCGGTSAIHSANQEQWQANLLYQRSLNRSVRCAPSLPRERFEAKCLLQTCKALSISERAYLELDSPPELNRPVKLRLNFRLGQDTTGVHAVLKFSPDGIRVLEGAQEWRGDLKAGQDQSLEMTIQSERSGYYRIDGLVEYLRDGQTVSLGEPFFIEINPQGTVYNSAAPNRWPENSLAYPVDADDGLIDSLLTVEPEPALGEEFTLTYRVTPKINLSSRQVYLQIGIPKEIKITNSIQVQELPLSGLRIVQVIFPPQGENFPKELAWRGPILKDQSVEIKVVFKVLEPGAGRFFGSLRVQAGGEAARFLQDSQVVEIHVDSYRGYVLEISDQAPQQ